MCRDKELWWMANRSWQLSRNKRVAHTPLVLAIMYTFVYEESARFFIYVFSIDVLYVI